jgi:hypothetical protein
VGCNGGSIVKPKQTQQVPAIVHHGDRHRPLVLDGMLFSGGQNGFDVFCA